MKEGNELSQTWLNPKKKQDAEVLIIGGGVIGSAIAYYLSRDGKGVLQLEADHEASGASGCAAGMLAAELERFPSAELKTWALRSQQLMTPLIEELKLHSSVDVAMNKGGFVFPTLEKDGLRKQMDNGVSSEITKKYEWWDQSKLKSEIPFLTSAAKEALFYPGEHQLLPAQLTKAYRRGAEAHGAVCIDDCSVSKLLIHNGRVTRVETNRGTYTAENVVVAAGLGSTFILRFAGIDLYTYPVKGEVMALSMPSLALQYTIYTHDVYIVPKPGNEIWIGATTIPYEKDKKVSMLGIKTLLEKAESWIPNIGEASFLRTWAGLRPQTADGLPYIGAYPEIEGLYLAAGHYRNGILLSAVTGETISRLLSGESEEEIGITSFSVSRLLEKRSVTQ